MLHVHRLNAESGERLVSYSRKELKTRHLIRDERYATASSRGVCEAVTVIRVKHIKPYASQVSSGLTCSAVCDSTWNYLLHNPLHMKAVIASVKQTRSEKCHCWKIRVARTLRLLYRLELARKSENRN